MVSYDLIKMWLLPCLSCLLLFIQWTPSSQYLKPSQFLHGSFVCFSINHLGVLPVYHMILIANMICDCRFVADTGCPGLFCFSEDSCDAIHFFTMFFYSCSQWPSCFSNVDTFTVFTWYLVNHLWLFLVTDSVFGVHQEISQRKEVDSITGIFTRAEKTRAASICNRSCLQWESCDSLPELLGLPRDEETTLE